MIIYSNESVPGNFRIEFVAFIIRNKIYCQLTDEMESYVTKPNYLTFSSGIKELEKIEMIRQMDGINRLDHAVSARQENVLKTLNLDANHVGEKTIDLGKTLIKTKSKIKPEEEENGTEETNDDN